MNKWAIGSAMLGTAVFGAVFLVARPGDPPPGAPGGVREASAQPMPPAPPAEPSTYFVEEMMPSRPLLKKGGQTVVSGIAGRRAFAGRTVYFVEFYDPVMGVSVCVEAGEAKSLVEFLKNTKGALPAEAMKDNEKRVEIRRWQTRDAFGDERYANLRVTPGGDSVIAYFGSGNRMDLSAKDFAAELDKVLADVEVLKKYPVKR